MRLFFTACFLLSFSMPLMALAVNNASLPVAVQQSLNSTVASGDSTKAQAEAAKQAQANPSQSGQITAYMHEIIEPAMKMMSVIGSMDAQKSAPVEQDEDIAALAKSLNDIDVGSAQ